ncbi:MAG: B12-binding domain-containing radical SAM protein [Clostridia bacterium]|nr:B12-binding domain-containing radical SAM protein [Clostridia bacterium]
MFNFIKPTKILFTSLNSKYIHSNLALKYLMNNCQEITKARPGVDEIILLDSREYTINNSYDYIYTDILLGQYKVICFSCYIWNIESIINLAKDIKKAVPDTIIIFGGPEVSYESEKYLEYADIVISGEGDESLLNTLIELRDKDFKAEKHVVYSQLYDFANRPFPYKEVDHNKIIYYESSRGCPFNCSYCMSSIDKTVRALPVEKVKEELQFFIDRKIKQLKFVDRTFNYDLSRAKELFSYIIENDNGITNFHMELCGDIMDDETIEILSKARKGLFQFEIGIQSNKKETLKAIHRHTDNEKNFKYIEKLIALGNAHIHVDLIAGLPYEDIKSFAESFNAVYNLGADNLQLGFLKLLKGTEIYDKRDEFQYRFQDRAPYQIISNEFMSAYNIAGLKELEEVLDLYHNKGGFARSINMLIEDNPYRFYSKLAFYYYKNGYQHVSHSKMELYRILLAFMKESNIDEDVAKETLLEDMKDSLNEEEVKRFLKKGWD